MSYTYRELLDKLNELDEENLDKTVSVYLNLTDEYVEVFDFWVSADDIDVLDAGHPVIEVEY